LESGVFIRAPDPSGAEALMRKTEKVYRRLQRHLDRMPVAYPATKSGVELRILERLFTPEEAELALQLSALPEPVTKIRTRARRAGLAAHGVETRLEDMASRGIIRRVVARGRPRYSKLPLAVGMFEFQVDRLTPGLAGDVLEYMNEAFGQAFHTRRTSQMRTIPINEEVVPDRQVGTYDQVRCLIEAAEGPFAVINCVCRQAADLLGRPCRQTDIRRTCLLLGGAARMSLEGGAGVEVTRERMLELVARADREGMVLQPQNTQFPSFICCCCGCCCGVLSTAKNLPRPADYFDTNYQAVADPDLCIACGTCAPRCQMDAIDDASGTPIIDLGRCIGCGLCVSACEYGALHLEPRPETRTPPRDETRLYGRILLERYGPSGVAGLMGRKLLGLKI
jgi:Na+-translocating ferredoxin:NAD+ oxidoreductase subunit B